MPVYEVVGEREREGRVGRSWRTPLIGRARERERLEQVWSSVRAGEGAAVALVGGRGIGKSRLASAVAAEAASEQATVLECACTELDATSAYRVVPHVAGAGRRHRARRPADARRGPAREPSHRPAGHGPGGGGPARRGARPRRDGRRPAAGPGPAQAGRGVGRAAGRVGRPPGRGGADRPADRRRSRRRPLQPGGAGAAGRRPAAGLLLVFTARSPGASGAAPGRGSRSSASSWRRSRTRTPRP